ncbi:MAG: CBS domain-containing protein [Bacteroidetes bacterium]|nr:CBS domain-containing protein [Bacteroidota bacterium]
MEAVEHMIREGMFDHGVRRIGAEQELFLVDDRWQPASTAMEILARNEDERVVTELTRFNLEFNLNPYEFGGDALTQMEQQLNEVLDYVRKLAEKEDTKVVLSGILPTIHLSDLELDNMAPMPRYFALNDAINRLRGGPATYHIRGTDELFFKHDTILVEGCNTSFQTHFQVTPEEFGHLYNIAQVVAAPCLAAATNSPVLFGKRLWKETRIALFQQAVDTRSSNLYLREMSPRVHFGTGWVESVLDIYREDVARFRVLMTARHEDPFEVLRSGGIPKLRALQLHNGTVYRWNRPCYGITNGVPHLRIENRILPSGPSIVDEVANSAFWFGLVAGLSARYEDIRTEIDFDDAKTNFVAAARLGLSSQLAWFGDKRWPAEELIASELLPIARQGLTDSGIDESDVERYLGIIDERVRSHRTGSHWMLASLSSMRRSSRISSRVDRLNAVVSGMLENQLSGKPVHEWPLATLDSVLAMRHMKNTRVEHFMSTDLFTVNEEELVELTACLMDWRHIRHVLIEDTEHRLVGLVTHRRVLRFLSSRTDSSECVPVKEIMIRNPITVTSETKTVDALLLMKEKQITALPVLQDGQLVGIITERDFYNIAGGLLDDSMARSLQ